jgi:DNA (cytosine-5)-methyltransferase 1
MKKKLKISQATQKGYIEIEEGGVFDAAYPSSKTRRGRVQGGGTICPTIMCGSELLLFEGYEDR